VDGFFQVCHQRLKLSFHETTKVIRALASANKCNIELGLEASKEFLGFDLRGKDWVQCCSICEFYTMNLKNKLGGDL
jgi:hypothetical protein